KSYFFQITGFTVICNRRNHIDKNGFPPFVFSYQKGPVMGGVAWHDNYRGTAFFKIFQRTQQTFSRTVAAFSGKIVAAIGTAAVAVVNHGNVVSVAFGRNPA